MRRLLTRQLTRSVNSPTSSVNTSLDYWTNFMEWHAHMMERMLVADYRDMQARLSRVNKANSLLDQDEALEALQ